MFSSLQGSQVHHRQRSLLLHDFLQELYQHQYCYRLAGQAFQVKELNSIIQHQSASGGVAEKILVLVNSSPPCYNYRSNLQPVFLLFPIVLREMEWYCPVCFSSGFSSRLDSSFTSLFDCRGLCMLSCAAKEPSLYSLDSISINKASRVTVLLERSSDNLTSIFSSAVSLVFCAMEQSSDIERIGIVHRLTGTIMENQVIWLYFLILIDFVIIDDSIWWSFSKSKPILLSFMIEPRDNISAQGFLSCTKREISHTVYWFPCVSIDSIYKCEFRLLSHEHHKMLCVICRQRGGLAYEGLECEFPKRLYRLRSLTRDIYIYIYLKRWLWITSTIQIVSYRPLKKSWADN